MILTVESGVTVDTSAAEPVELENHTFATGTTTIIMVQLLEDQRYRS